MSRSRTIIAANLLAASLLIGAMGLSVTGCSNASTTVLPTGVVIDVYQNRIDYAEHKIEVAVANNTDSPFDVLGLSFSSPAFTPAAEYQKAPTTVRAGTTIDFRLQLPPADCAGKPTDPKVTVKFTFDGMFGETTFVPNDRMDQLPRIVAEDCRESEVAAIVTISPASALHFATIAGRAAAVVDFTATPTGVGGKLVIDSVRGTVLLDAVDPSNGETGITVPLDLDVGNATEPVTFSVTFLAARCDPHVVLEDKRGTFFPLTVTTKRDTGRIYLGVSDEVRTQLYNFVAESCDWS